MAYSRLENRQRSEHPVVNELWEASAPTNCRPERRLSAHYERTVVVHSALYVSQISWREPEAYPEVMTQATSKDFQREHVRDDLADLPWGAPVPVPTGSALSGRTR